MGNFWLIHVMWHCKDMDGYYTYFLPKEGMVGAGLKQREKNTRKVMLLLFLKCSDSRKWSYYRGASSPSPLCLSFRPYGLNNLKHYGWNWIKDSKYYKSSNGKCCHHKHYTSTTIFKGGGPLELRVRIFFSLSPPGLSNSPTCLI